MVLRCTLLFCLICLFLKIQICDAGEFEDRALGWLDSKLLTDDESFDFNKAKIKSNTFESKNYGLVYTRNISDKFTIKANIDLNKSKVEFGTLAQRLSSSEFELSSWYQAENYRVGISQRMVTDNKLQLPNAQEIMLPENTTLGVHMELPVIDDKHYLTMSVQQSSWDMSSSTLFSHADLVDNQVKLNYSMKF